MPSRDTIYYVYILANRSRNLYIGVTNNIAGRVRQHRELRPSSYTARYRITRLVYFERSGYINNAIFREKELKKWNRQRKVDLI